MAGHNLAGSDDGDQSSTSGPKVEGEREESREGSVSALHTQGLLSPLSPCMAETWHGEARKQFLGDVLWGGSQEKEKSKQMSCPTKPGTTCSHGLNPGPSDTLLACSSSHSLAFCCFSCSRLSGLFSRLGRIFQKEIRAGEIAESANYFATHPSMRTSVLIPGWAAHVRPTETPRYEARLAHSHSFHLRASHELMQARSCSSISVHY